MKQNIKESKLELANAVNRKFPELGLKRIIIGVPGGNPTVIFDISSKLPDQNTRKALNGLAMDSIDEIEQVGFLFINELDESEFSMAGGEACVNATRLAGLFINSKKFKSSGFDKPLSVNVDGKGEVSLMIDNPVKQIIKYGDKTLVDLGGIVQIIDFAGERKSNLISAKEIDELKSNISVLVESDISLRSKSAVGLVKVYVLPNADTMILPVVWVRNVGTLIFETACGSGSIAVLEAMRCKNPQLNRVRLLQPSGMYLSIQKNARKVIVKSKVTIL